MGLQIIKTYAYPGGDSRGLLFLGNHVYVADSANTALLLCTLDFRVIRNVATSNTYRGGISTDGRTLYGMDPIASTFTKVDFNGNPIRVFALSTSNSHSLFFDSFRFVHTDVNDDTYVLLSIDGKIIRTLATGLTFAYGIAFDGRSYYVSNFNTGDILKVDRNGNIINSYTQPADKALPVAFRYPYLYIGNQTDQLFYQCRIYS